MNRLRLLVYAEGVNGEREREATLVLIERLRGRHEVVLPAQALGELFAVLYRKARRSAALTKAALLAWSDAYRIIDTTPAVLFAAGNLVEDHGFNFWDAVMLSSASQAQCRMLLSEHMQHGFTWKGTTVLNPYTPQPHPLLEAAF